MLSDKFISGPTHTSLKDKAAHRKKLAMKRKSSDQEYITAKPEYKAQLKVTGVSPLFSKDNTDNVSKDGTILKHQSSLTSLTSSRMIHSRQNRRNPMGNS